MGGGAGFIVSSMSTQDLYVGGSRVYSQLKFYPGSIRRLCGLYIVCSSSNFSSISLYYLVGDSRCTELGGVCKDNSSGCDGIFVELLCQGPSTRQCCIEWCPPVDPGMYDLPQFDLDYLRSLVCLQ